jgi:hypothetical protein
VLKRDKGKPRAEAGTNLPSDVRTDFKTPNSCTTEIKEYDEENKD